MAVKLCSVPSTLADCNTVLSADSLNKSAIVTHKLLKQRLKVMFINKIKYSSQKHHNLQTTSVKSVPFSPVLKIHRVPGSPDSKCL